MIATPRKKRSSFRRPGLILSGVAAQTLTNPSGIEVLVVKDPGGAVAFKGKTGPGGEFATGSLEAGNYVIQFTSKNSAALKGNQYSIAAVGGQKAVTANAVAGEKFGGGGVAMKVAVAAHSKLTGQVVAGATAAAEMVGSAKQEGSRRVRNRSSSESLGRMQDLGGQGAATLQGGANPNGGR